MSAEPSAVPADPLGLSRPWRGVHRALAVPLRIRLLQALWHGPSSAKQLAADVGLPPDRLYYHLRQLQQAGIIEVDGYRPLPGGKVERLYRRSEAEPSQDTSSPEEVAAFLGSVLEVTGADISAAFLAKEAGKRREVYVAQGSVRLTDEALAELCGYLRDLERRFGDPGAAGTWARALIVVADLEDRPHDQTRPDRARPETPSRIEPDRRHHPGDGR
jgi:DNA-binding transcriptional ArsR family regulator